MNEPRFILSRKKVFEQYEKAKKLSDLVSYSSKTNPEITKILEASTDSLFSIHSIHELKNITNKKRIIYLAQGWDEKEITFLVKEKIFRFVVDNIIDLKILKGFILKNPSFKLDLFLRLKLKENTLKTERYFVFGFSSDFINKEIPELRKIPGISHLGIHFHRKTQNLSEWNLKEEIEDTIEKETFDKIDFLIMGGGLPSIYTNTNMKVFEGIFSKIKNFKNWLNGFGIKLIIEPGRFISAPAVKLETNIKAIYENNIIIDASVYNGDLDAIVVPVKLLVENEVEKGKGKAYSIKGITPCSMDLFRYRTYLKEPKVGDKLVFLNAGAYNFTTDFCDLPKIKTFIVE